MTEEAEILASASQRVGSVLHGKYHIDGVLGVGGMATVYCATHRNRKRFAVKMLHPEYSVRKDLRARFVREGYVANSVGHPGVVAVLDDDVDETGSPFLVMELLEGVTVDSLYTTSGAPIPVRQALAITCQLLDVLEAAHEKSVVHRDIKPSNLFILRDGELKVLDFGIARLREVDSGLKSTRTGAALGTPAFMAPEQARAMPEAIDTRTDIWGAGATLFTMLTARFVHNGDNARQIMIQAATEPAPSIESIMPELPRAVSELVARALSFEPSARWPSAASMREAALAAHRLLFSADPVRADIADLVARTSAAVGAQPTEPQLPVTASPEPGLPAVRSLQTTASTPVSTRREGASPRPRWPWALLAAGALAALAGVWALRAPTPAPVSRVQVHAATLAAAPARVEPVAVLSAAPSAPPVETQPIDALPTSPSGSPAPSRPHRTTKPRATAPNVRAITSAAPTVQATTAVRPSDNPLRLELQ